VHDAFVDGLAKRAAKLRLGNPLEGGTTMGPLISRKQMERVLGYIDAGRREGAQTVCGGGRAGNAGYFVQPTVFANVGEKMRIAQEEIFGPVVSVMRFSDEEEAVSLANGTDLQSCGRGLDQRPQPRT
jgi:aldehyde dehydrogenase (NAD+)